MPNAAGVKLGASSHQHPVVEIDTGTPVQQGLVVAFQGEALFVGNRSVSPASKLSKREVKGANAVVGTEIHVSIYSGDEIGQ